MFWIGLLQEKYRKYGRKLHMVFIHLEKAYNTSLETWYGKKKINVPKAFIDIIKDMYENSITLVETTVREIGEIEIKISWLQGSTLAHLCFYNHGRHHWRYWRRNTWAMLFPDDIALSGEKCDQVEGRLELWRTRLKDVGLKLSRKKTEHLPPPGK